MLSNATHVHSVYTFQGVYICHRSGIFVVKKFFQQIIMYIFLHVRILHAAAS